eukprot:comp20720_c0_seq1/m.27067 comp20720_c0_seq1/g.27067  ORF comp20720_c0_seq1/g.27067 comp20720_c0_seq1/m.27067 type:complete len:518 (-) comp20720_c0_seq1:269-1822(-)
MATNTPNTSADAYAPNHTCTLSEPKQNKAKSNTSTASIRSNPPVAIVENSQDDSPDIIKNFQLAWFGMTMGWGGTALAIAAFPGAEGDFLVALRWIGVVIWLWNMFYWCFFVLLFSLRCILYTKGVIKMLDHPAQFMFSGCLPMGLVTVALGFLNFGEMIGMSHDTAVNITYVLYWVDVALSLLAAFVPAYYMIVRQKHAFATMSSLWLLPFVANVVAAACGGSLSEKLDGDRGLAVVITSLVMWGMGVLIAAMIICVYFSRLVFFGMPPKGLGNSTWLVLGPIGQGASGILILGRKVGVLARTGVLCAPGLDFLSDTAPLCSFGHMAPGFTMLIGLLMWGFGCWWLLCAGTLSLHNVRKLFLVFGRPVPFGYGTKEDRDNSKPIQTDYLGLPFNLGWWGIIFPFCTQIFSTYQLYNDTHFQFFMWMGRIFCCIMVYLSFLVHMKTIHHAWDGRLWATFKPAPSSEKEEDMYDGGAESSEHEQRRIHRREGLALWRHTVMHPFRPAPKQSLLAHQAV